MGHSMEICQELKSEAKAGRDASPLNDLRLRILDYFIACDLPDDIFEGALKARLNDPDPTKEQSKVICIEILEAWRTRLDNRP